MTDFRINLSIAALTLAVTCSVGALAEDLFKYLDKPGNESLSVEYRMPRTDATAPIKSADTKQVTVPTPDKVALK